MDNRLSKSDNNETALAVYMNNDDDPQTDPTNDTDETSEEETDETGADESGTILADDSTMTTRMTMADDVNP